MSKISTKNSRRVFTKAKSMMIVPYVYDSELGDYVLGPDVYDVSAVVGDTISLERDSDDTQSKKNEYTNENIVENTTFGKYKISADCLDLQNSVMKVLFGAKVGISRDTEVEGAVLVKEDSEPMFAMIRVRFRGENIPDVIFPKVQLNSQLMLQQIKSRGGQGKMNGTVMEHMVVVKDTAHPGHLLLFDDKYADSVPIMFVPQNFMPLFFCYEKAPNKYVYTSVYFDDGRVMHDIMVNTIDGVFENI